MSDTRHSILKFSMGLAAVAAVAAGGWMLAMSGSGSPGAGAASGERSADSGSLASGQPIAAALGADGPGMRAASAGMTFAGRSVYDSKKSLGTQLPELRRFAQAGNSYATCVLATALDLCVQRMMGSADAPWSELESGNAIENGDDAQVVKISAEVERHKQLALMCDDVSQTDMLERDVWMERSAKGGNPRSMALYALNPMFGGIMRLEDMERIADYAKNAESMLNRSAKAGVPEAIAGVYRAYNYGEIGTSIGTVKVEKDPAKAAGAAMAMLEFAPDPDKAEIQKAIDTLAAGMDDAQRARMTGMRKTFISAYRSQSTARAAAAEGAIETPDATCSVAAGPGQHIASTAK